MDKGMYPFDVLKLKYKGFFAPECEITIGSLKLKNTEVSIPEIEVELAADGTAGGCRITIADKYDYKSTSWDSKLVSALKVGAKLKVSMGYSSKSEVFFGYVDDYTIEYNEDTGPRIYITGLDGLGYLMSVRSRVYAGEKKVGELVKQLLNDAVSAGAAEKMTVGLSVKDMTVQRIVEGEDSFTFLNTLAKQIGANFFCVDGEIVFDAVSSFSLAITTLEYGKGLIRFSKRLSLANQPSKVIIHGRDINNAPIKGEAKSTTLSGDGKGAADTASKLLKKSVYEEENPLVLTADECKKLAQNRFDDLAQNFVHGEGVCIGIPELIPGRFIKVAGMDKNTNGSYFLKKVVHVYNEDGYYTRFEVRGAKSK